MNSPAKSFWIKWWNEPRWFFFWLSLFSLVGLTAHLFINLNIPAQYPHPHLRMLDLEVASVLIGCLILGVACFLIAWIPPVNRLLAWLLQRRWFSLACLLTLVALFYSEENWRGKRAWDQFRHAAEAQGERFSLGTMAPPPVPDDQNFALSPIIFSTYGNLMDRHGHRLQPPDTNVVDRLDLAIYHEPFYDRTNLLFGSWQNARVADLAPWQDYYRNPPHDPEHPERAVTNRFRISPLAKTPSEDILLALSRYSTNLEELRAAASRPYSRFPLEYDSKDPISILLPHLSKMKHIANFLHLRILAELEAGQSDPALADVMLSLRLISSLKDEPTVISHLVRIAMVHIVLNPIWRGVAEHRWTAPQLAEIQTELEKIDFLESYFTGMRGERAFSIGTIDRLRTTRDILAYLPEADSGNVAKQVLALEFYVIPAGWYYDVDLAFAQLHRGWTFPMIDLQRRVVSPSKINLLQKRFDTKIASSILPSVKNLLVRIIFPSLERYAQRCAVAQGGVNLAVVGCALERYRLAHGEYPETLSALTPTYLIQVPADIINGSPLHYRRADNGYVVYSVGWNEVDDGGVVARREKSGNFDWDRGDWVWQVPPVN